LVSKKKKVYAIFAVLLSVLLVLSACGGNGSGKKVVSEKEKSKFPVKVETKKQPVKDGSLTIALVSDTPFEGTLSTALYTGQPDWEIIRWFDEPLLDYDNNYNISNTGAATYKLSGDKRTVTLTIRKGLKWSDGKPVTAEDLEYAYLVIASPKYKGVRYDSTFQSIEGAEAYHSGKAKNISGVKVLAPNKISITYKTANPTILSGLYTTPLPKHYLKDISIDKLASSPKIRKSPIGFGPFVVKKVVPGESVTFTRNDHYWRGKPKLKSLVEKVVNPNVVVNSLKNGDVDVASIPVDQYKNAVKNKNYTFLGTKDLAYSYIGFKLGHWDAKKSVNVMDRKKLQNVKLRQAMGYALNLKRVSDEQYSGLYYPANSLIPESFPNYNDKNLRGFTYNPKKAKKLLDEAGYKDVDKDGYREDPNGKKFVLNFASMSGSQVAEPIANFFIQNWKAVGLNVKLYNGRLQEFNSFYKNIESDNPKIDIFAATWGTGTDVNPAGLYDKTAQFNLERFVDADNEKLLAKGVSKKAFDSKYRQKVYNQWQELMFKKVPAIPTFFRYNITAVNKRVQYYNIDPTAIPDQQNFAVSSNTPVKGK
jgi:peptide/nickel transport system substrate-binding protein